MNIRKIIDEIYRRLIKALSHIFPFYKEIEIQFPNMSMRLYGIKIYRYFGLGKDFPINQCHEPICSEYLINLFKTKPELTFWDCGSSIGYYSVLVKHASQNKSGIHAFEAKRLYNKYINRSISEFTKGDFVLNNKLLGEQDNSKFMKLDTYAGKNGFPDVIKMDLDGFESSVLKGMTQIFRKSNPYFLLEVHAMGDYKTRLNIIRETIPEVKYRFLICDNHRFKNADWRRIDNLSQLPKDKTEIPKNDYILLCEPAEA
ncbi:MAG: FkbM family methyltransferase [Sedimentisphaerales bacterium]|nr:FkbM family methyltransferase [Sedimentisphaerales bacterium]